MTLDLGINFLITLWLFTFILGAFATFYEDRGVDKTTWTITRKTKRYKIVYTIVAFFVAAVASGTAAYFLFTAN